MMAEQLQHPRRRAVLAGIPAALLAAPLSLGAVATVVPPIEPDAGLVTASAAFCALEQGWQALDADGDDKAAYEAACADIEARQAPHLEALVHTIAAGAAGHRARAQAIATWWPDYLHHPDEDPASRMLRALLRDLLGLTDAEA